MWRRMGITRDAAGLAEAAGRVDHWCRYILPLEFDDPRGWTMQNMLIVARLMIAAATRADASRAASTSPRLPRSPTPAWTHHISMRCPPQQALPSTAPAAKDPHAGS